MFTKLAFPFSRVLLVSAFSKMMTYSFTRCRLVFSRNGNRVLPIKSIIRDERFWEKGRSDMILKRRIFFGKSSKNDIIKNEFQEIWKNEKDAFQKEINEREEKSVHAKIEKQDEHERKEKWKEKHKEKHEKTKGKFKRLFIFITFQSIPIVGLMYLFKYLESVKLSELNYTFDTSEDIIKEATKLIDSSCTCFCLYFDNHQINTIFIDPLNSEKSEKNYKTVQRPDKTEEKESDDSKDKDSGNVESDIAKSDIAKSGIDNDNDKNKNKNKKEEQKNGKNYLENIMYSINKPFMQELLNQKSSVDFSLNYIYFSISKNSDIHKYLKKRNSEISLLYSDEKKNVYVTLNGKASIIKNDELKKIMWNDKWSYIIDNDTNKQNYILVKFTPFLISVKTIGMKEEHWKNNVVIRKINKDMYEWEKV